MIPATKHHLPGGSTTILVQVNHLCISSNNMANIQSVFKLWQVLGGIPALKCKITLAHPQKPKLLFLCVIVKIQGFVGSYNTYTYRCVPTCQLSSSPIKEMLFPHLTCHKQTFRPCSGYLSGLESQTEITFTVVKVNYYGYCMSSLNVGTFWQDQQTPGEIHDIHIPTRKNLHSFSLVSVEDDLVLKHRLHLLSMWQSIFWTDGPCHWGKI
jgi:hypothetical protein